LAVGFDCLIVATLFFVYVGFEKVDGRLGGNEGEDFVCFRQRQVVPALLGVNAAAAEVG
jgi:hypothetical protein